MAGKLNPKQQVQLAILEPLPKRFDQINRMVEELASLRTDESLSRQLARNLDEIKAQTASVGLASLADTCGMMATLARRTGGIQMRVRGLREGLTSLKINFDGALKSAMTPMEDAGEDEPG